MPVGDTPDSLDYCPPRRQLDVVRKLNGTGGPPATVTAKEWRHFEKCV
jgi:hypothetical protein